MDVLTLQIWRRDQNNLAERISTNYFPLQQFHLAEKQLLQWYSLPDFIYGDIIQEPLEMINCEVSKKIYFTKAIITLEQGEIDKYNAIKKELELRENKQTRNQ